MRPIDADELKKDLTRFYDNEVTAKQLIDGQPTIEPEQRWIPVTEIPPYGKDLMIRLRDNRNGCRYFNYYVMGFYDGKEYQTYLFRHQDDHDIEVTGWMICPWEEGGQDE